MDTDITLLSLLVALFSVLLSPLVALAVSKRATTNAMRVAKKNIVAPMRQKWIDSVRDTVSELTSLVHHHFIALHDEHPEQTESLKKIHFMERRLRLLLNPNESDHKELVTRVGKLTHILEFEKSGPNQMAKMDSEIMICAQKILKSEWKRVKDED